MKKKSRQELTAAIARQQPLLYAEAEQVVATPQRYLRTPLWAFFSHVDESKRGADPEVFLQAIPEAAKAWCADPYRKKEGNTAYDRGATCCNYFDRLAKLACMAAQRLPGDHSPQAEGLLRASSALKRAKMDFVHESPPRASAATSSPELPLHKALAPKGQPAAGDGLNSSNAAERATTVGTGATRREPVATITKPDGTVINIF